MSASGQGVQRYATVSVTMRTIKPLTIYPLLSFLSFGAFIFHLWFNRDGRSHESIHNSTPSQPQFTPDEASASRKPLQPADYDSAVRNSTLGVTTTVRTNSRGIQKLMCSSSSLRKSSCSIYHREGIDSMPSSCPRLSLGSMWK